MRSRFRSGSRPAAPAPPRRGAARLAAIVDALNRIMAAVCHLLLAAIVAVTVTQVFLRFVLSAPLSWSEELALLLLIWYGMISVAVGVGRHSHIAIATLRDRLPPRAARRMDLVAQLFVLGFAVAVFVHSFALIGLSGLQIMPALGFSKAWLYYPAAVGSALMALNVGANLILRRLSASDMAATG